MQGCSRRVAVDHRNHIPAHRSVVRVARASAGASEKVVARSARISVRIWVSGPGFVSVFSGRGNIARVPGAVY